MHLRRMLLPLSWVIVVLAGTYSVTAQFPAPASPVPCVELQMPVAAPALDGPCLAANGEPGLEPFLESQAASRKLCVDTQYCGGCCGSRGQIRRFLDCCAQGGGYACEVICY